MKLGIFGVLAAIVIAIGGLVWFGGAHGEKGGEQEFLRLHIRANSNSRADQDVKFVIKQQIVDELTPMFTDVADKTDAVSVLADHIDRIREISDRVLAARGFKYTTRAVIRSEKFPTRNYTVGDTSVTLPNGIYDALILELGRGTGDNWWCVVYPPLCILENSGGNGIQYRSKILPNS